MATEKGTDQAANEVVDRLATVPKLWTRGGWIRRLTYLADSCKDVNPQRSAELREAVHRLETGGGEPLAVGH